MAIYKNKASQKVAVFAYDSSDGSAKTGDAAQITAQISKDGAACAATDDTNPTELDAADAPGVYLFDLTQAETNADLIVIAAVSSTEDILLEPLLLYTQPEVRDANATQISGSSAAANNAEIVFDTDFSTNYNTTRDAWVTNAQDFVGTTAADPFNGQVVSASVTAGVSLGNGAITNASLAGNMEIVFETDFATNYDTDNNKWQTEADVTKWKGSAPADLTDTDKVQVSVQHMANSIIAAANIASDAIAAAKIANGAITAAKLGADCITSDKIADDAIGDEHWNVTSVSANLSDAAKLSIQKIAAGGIR